MIHCKGLTFNKCFSAVHKSIYFSIGVLFICSKHPEAFATLVVCVVIACQTSGEEEILVLGQIDDS